MKKAGSFVTSAFKASASRLNGWQGLFSWRVARTTMAVVGLAAVALLFTPRRAETAVAPLNQWTSTAVIDSSTATSPRTGTFTVSAGSNRLLVVSVVTEYSSITAHNISATYGGQALTLITENTSQRETVWIGYLKEAGIAAAANTTLSIAFNTSNFTRLTAHAATYSGVNQTTPIAGSNATSSAAAASLTYGASIPVVNGGYIFYTTIVNGTRTATQPGSYTEHFDTLFTDFSKSIASEAVVADGTENQTVTFSASDRCALGVASLNPSALTTVGDGTTPSNKNVFASTTNNAVSAFTLSEIGATDTVTGLVVTGTNTANVAASGVKIYEDNGSVANEWDSTDTLVTNGTASFSGSTATFSGLSIPVNGTATQYLITYDIGATPTVGNTLTGVVTSVTATNPVTNNDTTDATLTIGTTFYSQTSGSPNTLANWNSNRAGGGSTPANFTSGNRFVVQGTGNGGTTPHSMTTSATWTVSGSGAEVEIENGATLTTNNATTVERLTIFSGGTVSVGGIALTVNNGNASGADLSVAGTLNCSNSSSNFVYGAGATGEFLSGGKFTFGRNGGGTLVIPVADWDANSTLEVTGITSSVPVGLGQSFGNVIWNCTSQTVSSATANGLTIQGNLTIQSTGTGALHLPNDTANTIGGNYTQSGGTFQLGNNLAHSLTVSGNFTLSGGTYTNLGDNSPGQTLSVAGDFFITGGTIDAGATGLLSVAFNGGTTQTFKSGATVSNTVNYTVNSGTTLQMDVAGTVVSGTTFTLSSGATLGIRSTAGITTSGATGNVQVTSTRTYSTGASYIYNGSANQAVGNGLPATVASLTIANTGSSGSNVVTLAQATTISSTLSVTAGTFDQGATFNISAVTVSVASGGTYRNLGTGDLTLGSGGVSNAGTINFDGSGAGCGGADAISILSSASPTQRAWTGTGTFSMTDVTVRDQAGTAVILVNSGTSTSNNGANWIFVSACTANAYTWIGGLNADWQIPTNWSPTRTTPAVGDVLTFDGNVTPSPIVTDVPTQTVAQVLLTNGIAATFNASSVSPPQTLTINGTTGTDLSVPSGTSLTLAGANVLKLVLGASATGSVGGQIVFQDAAHRLIGGAASAVTFASGAFFTTASGFTGNAFGTGSGGDGAAGSIVFASGSIYFHNAGSSPFGASANPSVVTFQSGSEADFYTATGFDASGRTYANLVIGKGDPSGVAVNASDSGTGNFQFDNLVINNTGSANSSLTFTGSGTNTITIRGNISSVAAGAGGTLPDVIFTAGSGGIVIDKSGGGTVTFGNSLNTRTIEFESNTTINSGTTVSLARKLLLGIVQPSSLVMTVNGGLTGSASGYLIGNEKRSYTVPEFFTYHVGTVNGYSKMEANVTAGTGDLTVAAVQGARTPPLTSATSLQRYWRLTKGGSITSDITFYYNDPLDISGTESNYRIIVVDSGNATSFPADSDHIVDTTNNKFTVLGETTFSDWTLGEPGAPTAAKLNGFTATRDGNEVMLQWQTGFEAHNLGFNIYREENGQRTRITPSLVAGSALKAGRQTVMGAGSSYAWYDQIEQKAGSGVTYWLEDVDLNGTRTLHGPIAIADGKVPGAKGEGLKGTRAPLLNEVTRRTPASGVFLRAWPKAFDAQQAALTRVPQPGGGSSGETERQDDPEAPPAQQSGLSQLQIEALGGIKIAVSQAGWLRVTQPELIAAGLDANVNARKLQLYANGVAVPIKQSGDGVRLTASDYIEFYGHGLDLPTDASQTYYLVVGKGAAGSRIGVANPQTVAPPSGPQNFNYTVERKEREIYFSGLLNGDAENFFGQIVSTDPITETVPVSHLVAGGATLELTLQGVTTQGHSVHVLFNGTDLGMMNFANTDHPRQTFSVPAPALREGDNSVELTALGGDGDVSLVDSVRLTYTHAYTADNNSLAISVNNANTSRIDGFTNGNIRVIDITDPAKVIEMTPAASIIQQQNGTYSVDVQLTSASPNNVHTLLVFGDAQVLQPDLVKRNEPSSWASQKVVGADYVIITNRDFKAGVEPLAQLRRSQGMTVNVIDVEDLYDEFSFGAHTPTAIRDYLEVTQTFLKRQPYFVLLVGDASYDPKNYFGQGNTDFVPTKLIDTSQMETASDDWFADFDGDGVADLAIGRLPVRSAADTNVMVSKIINYESMTPDPQQSAMLVADNTFEAASSSVQSLLPAAMPVQVINRNSADDATIHAQIINALNQGPVVANYFGHGSNGVWTGAGLLSNPDAATLTNQNRLSLFMMMTCFNGYFQDPYNDSLAEALLKSQGGAVAVWASTSLTEPEGQTLIDQELYRQLFSSSPPRLGDAVRIARRATTDSDVRRTWLFFGDPAMRLKRAAPGPSPKPGKAPTDK